MKMTQICCFLILFVRFAIGVIWVNCSTSSALTNSSSGIQSSPMIPNRLVTINEEMTINILGLFVRDSEIGIETSIVHAALELGAMEIRKLYPRVRINFRARIGNNTCLTNNAGVLAAEEYYTRGVTAFVGPACSLALKTVARMSSYWNVPVLTAGGFGNEFSDKSLYPTLIRLAFSTGE